MFFFYRTVILFLLKYTLSFCGKIINVLFLVKVRNYYILKICMYVSMSIMEYVKSYVYEIKMTDGRTIYCPEDKRLTSGLSEL